MALGDSDKRQQVLVRAENVGGYCNLGSAPNGVPNAAGYYTPGSDPASGLSCANPNVSANYEVAENEETRNRPYHHANTLLTRNAETTLELYMRGNGADDTDLFSSPTYTFLDAFWGIKAVHTVEHDVNTFVDTTSLQIADAYEDGLRAGMGFTIALPTGRTFTAFVKTLTDITAPGALDTIVFDPPMTAAELTAAQNAPADSLKLRGGLTYGVGDEYRANTSLYLALVKQAYVQETYGGQGSSITANLETGQAGILQMSLMSPYTNHGGLAPTMAVVSWTATDTCTVSAPNFALLRVGMFADVTTTLAPAGKYRVRIRALDSATNTVTFEPTALPAGITGEAPVPGLTKIKPGATAQPAGPWLRFLNGRAWANGQYRAIRSANWQIDLNPALVPDPNNEAGAVSMEMGDPTVTCDMVLSYFDDGENFQGFLDGDQFSVLCVLANHTRGNTIALYAPAMHNTKPSMPGEADNLTTTELSLRSGLHEADTDPYDGVGVSNTVARLFVAW